MKNPFIILTLYISHVVMKKFTAFHSCHYDMHKNKARIRFVCCLNKSWLAPRFEPMTLSNVFFIGIAALPSLRLFTVAPKVLRCRYPCLDYNPALSRPSDKKLDEYLIMFSFFWQIRILEKYCLTRAAYVHIQGSFSKIATMWLFPDVVNEGNKNFVVFVVQPWVATLSLNL